MSITKQVAWSIGEQPTVTEGAHSRFEGLPLTANPYPAVCQQSLRDHWLWDQGWYLSDRAIQEAA
jgi:hypothetical protein